MRNLYAIAIMIVASLFQPGVKAQDVMDVTPGLGTLNAAITANGASKIYRLKAGEWYGLDAIIQNDGYHLQIIGEEPADGAIPATLQTGSTGEGAPFPQMFNTLGNITLKNIYLMNSDLAGQIGGEFLRMSKDNSRTIVDKCIIDPATGNNGVVASVELPKIYFTNNLVIRAGHMLSPNDGHFFVTQGGSMLTGTDTLLVENNTFVAMGTNMWMANFAAFVHNFVWWNHNTIVCNKSQLDWSLFENEYYFTNNLLYDVNTQAWAEAWGRGMPGGDPGTEYVSLIYADTLVSEGVTNETLPSTRVQFIQYNMQYRAQGFKDLITEINALDDNDTVQNVYLMPLIWEDEAHAAGSREAKLFANDEAFPKWKYGNSTTDIDPQWTDPAIYEMESKFVEWTKPATYLHALGFPASDFPAATEWPQWHWEPDGDISINSTWPVFDGTYKNAALMTASIEKLPLGDLNWFPAKKAIWTEKKEIIEAHIKSLNTEQLDAVTASVKELSSNALSSVKSYPNPFSDQVTLSFVLKEKAKVEIGIVNILGQSVAKLLNQSTNAGSYSVTWDGIDDNGRSLSDGAYFYVVRVNGVASTGKIVITK